MPPESEQQSENTRPRPSGEERSDSVIEQEKSVLQHPPEAESGQAQPASTTPEDGGADDREAAADGEQTAVEIPLEELTVEQWLEKLAAAEALAAERLEGQQRSLADFQNYKRRTTRDMQLTRQNAAATLLARFFPILDDLALALDSLPTTGDGAAWSEGVNMVHRKLMSVLEGEGVAPIEAKPGQEFDPHFHEAIAQEDHADYDSDLIIAVVRPGYRLDERVLRPTQVRVAK
jgi:molecular chaperone GrpE